MTDISTEARSDEQLAEQAFRKLYADILSGVLRPGAQVTEIELMERYALTRAPVRHAMVRLSQEGWIAAQPRRGYRVRPMILRDVREVFDLRKQLEPECARRAAGRVNGRLLADLDKATQAPYDRADRSLEDSFFTANTELHTGIAMAAGNQRIARLVTSLHHETERILRAGMRYANWSKGWQHGHGELLEALVAGDGERAYQIALRQINYSERVVMDSITDQLDNIRLYDDDRVGGAGAADA
jgi:DNA-binding GntR family transcriptional regulator